MLRQLIYRLRSDDMYGNIVHYPNSDWRSAALARQAACLYVILYCSPSVLQKDTATMRELVDKHFTDSWVR